MEKFNEPKFLQIASSEDPYPFDFDEAWKWIGYSTKQKAEQALTANFEKESDFLTSGLKNTGDRGRPGNYIKLSVDCFKSFCMMAGTAKGKEVRRYYLQVEKAFYAAKEKWSQVQNHLKEEIKATAEQIKQYDKVVDPFEHIAALERNIKLMEEKISSLNEIKEKVTAQKKHLTTNQINKIQKLNEQGLSSRQIAKAIGSNSSSVLKVIRQLKPTTK